jgi:hypothetical protein
VSRPLQQTGYRASNYERPNEQWSCGRLAEGCPCPFGPTSRGGCGWACSPRATEGGGHECGRPGGHHCEEGPNGTVCSQVACQPAPSIRRLRGALTLGVVLLTVAILAATLATKRGRELVVSPGDLSSHHAALACSDCHAAAAENESWTQGALSQQHVSAKIDSKKCSSCHRMLGGSASKSWTLAHTIDRDEMAKLQSDAEARWEGSADRPSPGVLLKGAQLLSQGYGLHDAEGHFGIDQQLDCGLCHGEHQGRDRSLVTEMPEHRCHICHTVGFDAFETNHPEFNSFGKRELAGNMIFTHSTHYEQYGMAPKDEHGKPDIAKGASCSTCHLTDPQGRHMVLKPRTYETECLRCHQKTTDPIEILQAPTGPELAWLANVSKRTLQAGLGDPKETLGLLEPMIGSDVQAYREDMASLRALYRELRELAPADEDGDEQFSEGDLPGASKALRNWLAMELQRQKGSVDALDLADAAELVKQVGKDKGLAEADADALQEWLVKRRRATIAKAAAEAQAWIGEADESLAETLAPLVEAVKAFGEAEEEPDFATALELASNLRNDKAIKKKKNKKLRRKITALRNWLRAQEHRKPQPDRLEEASKLLAGFRKQRARLKKKLRAGEKQSEARARVAAHSAKVQALLAKLAARNLDPVRQALGLDAKVDLSYLKAVFPAPQLKQFASAWWAGDSTGQSRNLRLEPAQDALEVWQGGGRWLASDGERSLRYAGYTHLDPFLQSMSELAPLASPKAQAQLHAVFKERCAKCHATPGPAGKPEQYRVQWDAMAKTPESARRLTYFDHRAHIGLASCLECHQLLTDRTPADRTTSDFLITESWRQIGVAGQVGSGCRECHTPQRYGASCQLCHDYHAGGLTPGAGTMPRQE